ncbi:hypothetical protein [Oenococcus sp.]|uniref:hypothetical protein n=1 Tax=Oenococcus sp. TaxID=1979414 RepID=UPI0039EBC000
MITDSLIILLAKSYKQQFSGQQETTNRSRRDPQQLTMDKVVLLDNNMLVNFT